MQEVWKQLKAGGLKDGQEAGGENWRLPADNRTSFYSNPSYRTDARQQAVHTLVVLTGWPPFEGKRNGQTSREVSGHCWRHKADSGPTCDTGEAGHYSRSLASKAGSQSRHLLLVRKQNHQDADQEADQDQEVDQDEGDGECSGGREDAEVSTVSGCTGVLSACDGATFTPLCIAVTRVDCAESGGGRACGMQRRVAVEACVCGLFCSEQSSHRV